jgi:signal transduction histidine kinase
MLESDQVLQQLKRAVLEDPKNARVLFLDLFESASPHLETVLRNASDPGESRIRQMIANAVRTHPEKHRIIRHLLKWRDSEVDEFARRAVDAALMDVDSRQLEDKHRTTVGSPHQISGMYNYVAGRMRHRLRNSFLGVQNQAAEVRDAISSEDKDRVSAHLAKLNDLVRAISRFLESAEADPAYFEVKVVTLTSWIREMNERYATEYERIEVEFRGDLNVEIRGSEHLLDTAFWNIWVNAQQAVGIGCKISLELKNEGAAVRVLVVDNGPGFPGKLKDVAFKEAYSSRHQSRGRGLLEIQDAVARLGGDVDLIETQPGELRIELRLPTQGRVQ